MNKRNLLLERDFLIFDPWDALRTNGEPQEKLITFRKHSGMGITLSVYGTFGISDLTGEETIEDMVVELGGADVTEGLTETFLMALVHEALEEK